MGFCFPSCFLCSLSIRMGEGCFFAMYYPEVLFGSLGLGLCFFNPGIIASYLGLYWTTVFLPWPFQGVCEFLLCCVLAEHTKVPDPLLALRIKLRTQEKIQVGFPTSTLISLLLAEWTKARPRVLSLRLLISLWRDCSQGLAWYLQILTTCVTRNSWTTCRPFGKTR